MTARTDMWDKVAAETGKFAMSVAPTVLHVPPLSRTDLAEVISEPARRSHLTLEDGLVQRLVDDTGSGDALPLLAFTLARMAADAEDGRLTHAEYDAIGGRQGRDRVARRARSRPAAAPRQQVAEAILHLVNLTDETPHKRLARAADVPPQHREILDDLVDARLVVINEVNDQQVYAPGARVAVLGLAAAGRADRAPPRRPRAARPARAPGRRLARGRRHPVRAAVRPRARPGARLAAAQHRPGDRRRGGVRRRVDGPPAPGPDDPGRASPSWWPPSRSPWSSSSSSTPAPTGAAPSRPGSASWPRSPSASWCTTRAAAAAALLRGLELDPGASELQKLSRTLLRSPARDVYRAPGQATFFQLGVGRRRRRGDARATRPWSGTPTARRSAPSRRPVRSGGPAGRPGLRRGRRRRRAERLRPRRPRATTPTALTVFSANDQSVPVLAFSHDGSLLAEGRRSWVALWDMRDPSSPRRLAAWHSNVGDPTALAVLDDGRVLAASSSTQLAVWNALGDGSSADAGAGPAPTPAVQHLSVARRRQHGARSTTRASTTSPLVDLEHRCDDRHASARPTRARPPSALPPISWTSSLSPDGRTVASFDLAGRGLRLRQRRRAPAHRADRRPHLAGLRGASSTTPGCWSPPASTARCGCGTRAPRRPSVSGDLSDDLCRESSASRIDADSWELAFEDDDLDPPCPAVEPPAPAPLAGVELGRRRRRCREVSTPRTVAFQDTFDGASSFRTGEQQLATGTVTTEIKGGRYRMEVSGVGAGYTAWQSAATSGAGDTWAVTRHPGAQPRRVRPLRHRRHHPGHRHPGPRRGQRDRWPGSAGSATPTTSRSRIPVGTAGELSLVDDQRRDGGAPRRPAGGDRDRPACARPPASAWPPTVMRRAATSTTSRSRQPLDRRPRRRGRPRGAGRAAGGRDPAPAVAAGGGRRGGGHPGRARHRAGRPGRARGHRPRAAAGGRLPGHDPGGRRRVRPGRPVRRRGPAGRPGQPRPAGPAAARRLPAGRPGDRGAQPRRHGRAAHPDRRRRGRHARHVRPARRLRLPADGELRLAAASRSPTSPTCSRSPTSTSTSSASRAGWHPCCWSCSSWSTSACGCCSAASSRCRRRDARRRHRPAGARRPGRRGRADAGRLRRAVPLGRRPGVGVVGARPLVLVGWAGVRGLVGPRDVARAAHPSFALLVLALGVAVAAVATGLPRRPGRTAWCRAARRSSPCSRWRCWPPCSRPCSPTSRPRSCWCRWSPRSAPPPCWRRCSGSTSAPG